MEEGAPCDDINRERSVPRDELARELGVKVADLPARLRHFRRSIRVDPENPGVDSELSAAHRARGLPLGGRRLLEKTLHLASHAPPSRPDAAPLWHIDAMARADGRRAQAGDTCHARTREVTRTEIELRRDVTADDEESASRKAQPLHVRDDALEERDCAAPTVRHRHERLADRGIRGKPLGVPAGVAHEHAPSAQAADLPKHLHRAAERADALPARSGTTAMSSAMRPRSGATIALYPFACAAFAAVTTMRSNFICWWRRRVQRRTGLT